MSAFGWGREDREWVQELAKNGIDPISSLGFDGPLAALSKERQNIADYFKEAVAVVTNPAIDREREVEHFSTQTVIGPRPPLIPGELAQELTLTFESPILLDDPRNSPILKELVEHFSKEVEFITLERLTRQFLHDQITFIPTITLTEEAMPQALERMAETMARSIWDSWPRTCR
jgi:glutamate synthase (NADPH/NADH) large chain